MIIAIDIDDVINDLGVKTAQLFNRRFNKSLTIDDFVSFDFYEWLSKEDADNIVSLFRDKELWDSLKPISGARSSIQKLINDGHKVVFATATDPVNFNWKVTWMQEWFPFVNTNSIIRIIDKSLLKCDILIDDNMDNLMATNAVRICVNMPWNQQSELRDEARGIVRCNTWNDIIEILNKINKEFEQDG